MDRPRPVDRDVECIRWLANARILARRIESRRLSCSRAILSQRPSLTSQYRNTCDNDIQQGQ
jgi:hypothetical protein